MTRDQMLSNLFERLTSRKLLLCLLSVGFGLWNYAEGRLSAVEFQTAVFAAIGVYTVSQGITDAVGAYRPKPSTGDAQTVVVGTEAQPAITAALSPPAATSKRVRPSRAKPAAVLTVPVVTPPASRRARPRPTISNEAAP